MPSIKVDNADKIYHAGAYFIMAILWYLFFNHRYLLKQSVFNFTWKEALYSWSKPIVIGASVLSFIIGVLIEFAQGYIARNRTMDFLDVIANTTGIILAVFILKITSQIFNRQS